MSSHFDHYINNAWKTGKGPAIISRNPATEEIIWQGNGATSDEVIEAIEAARNALPEWANSPLEKRISLLQKFADTLKENLEEFSEIIAKDTGKPLWESKGEIQSMINKIPISIEAFHLRCPELTKQHPTGISFTKFKPYGVVAIFGPFNFPAHLPNGHIIPALLAGNTVIFKPSELTPLVAEKMMQYWAECNLPAGVINMIQGGRETGRTLAGNPLIDGLYFTGSWETGQIFMEQFAKHPEKILAVEMGGNNPLVVSSFQDVTAAAYATIQAAYLSSGQRCSCARRLILIKNQQTDLYIQQLVRMIQQIKVGPYTDSPEPFMGPVISEFAVRHLLAVQETLKSKGGRPLVEMRLMKVDTALLTPGLMDVTNITHRPDEEIFGPFLQLILVPDIHAAIDEANNTSFGLTAGLFSTDKNEYELFYQKIRAGIINWNSPLTGASSSAPFGGLGKSGNHRPSAYFAADYCSYPVASLENPNLSLPPTLTPGIEIKE